MVVGGCDSLKLTPLVEEIVSVAEEQHEECDDLEHDINDMEVAVQLFQFPPCFTCTGFLSHSPVP